MRLMKPCIWAIRPFHGVTGTSFASLRRFGAVAARRNSSRAPFGPLRQRRSSFRMRFRCDSPPKNWTVGSGDFLILSLVGHRGEDDEEVPIYGAADRPDFEAGR